MDTQNQTGGAPPHRTLVIKIRESWDVILSIFGLCGLVVTWLAPAFGIDEISTPTAWAVFAGAAQVMPVNRLADKVLGR